jgi:tetratricopeptide (TPR) repeat protein
MEGERRITQPMIADKPDVKKGDGDGGNSNRSGDGRRGDGDNKKSFDGNKGDRRDGDRRDNDGDRKGNRDGDRDGKGNKQGDFFKQWDNNNRRGDGDRKGGDRDRDGRGRGDWDKDRDRDHDHGDHWNKWNNNNRRHNWEHGHWHGNWDRRRWNNNWWWDNSWNRNRYFWGVSGWWYGPSFYNWGYYPYYNPYCRHSILIATPYDYAQPFNSVEYAAPLATAAESDFDIARNAFFNMDYAAALLSIDAALAQTPGDAALHQFRALVLFARGEYEPAAATIHSILSVGPGWDWQTMRQFYPAVDTYTQQLRRLEDFRRSNPRVSEARFLLAYHYMTTGYNDAAAKELQEVVAIEPKDRIAAQLLGSLTQQIPDEADQPGQQPIEQQQIIPSKPANPATPVLRCRSMPYRSRRLLQQLTRKRNRSRSIRRRSSGSGMPRRRKARPSSSRSDPIRSSPGSTPEMGNLLSSRERTPWRTIS